MTEEIIINGVNVAGCEYYKGKCMEYTHYCQIGCKECTDIGIKLCHYKQTERFKAKIKRLEQENKELKEIINKSAKNFCNDYLKTFEENKFLNKQIMEVKFNAQQEIEFLTEENNTYRSALEKIKAILDKECGVIANAKAIGIINEVL